MAQRHARLGTDMWSEPSIRALKRDPQRAYLLASSQPELSRCGVLPFRIRRLANLAADDSPSKLRKAFADLEASQHVVIDEDAEELLVRTYVRHDGLLAQPQVVAAMVSDYRLIESATIRTAFLREIRRIWHLEDLDPKERNGLRLALGEHGTTEGKFRTKIGRGLTPSLHEAIEAGSVEAFDAACPAGCPAAFDQPLAGARAPSPAPAPAPAPMPSPSPDPAGPAGPGERGGGTQAQALLDTHLAQLGPMPHPAVEQLRRHIDQALTDGQPAEVVTAALAEWRRRPLSKPGLLPHLIGDAARAQAGRGVEADPASDPDIAAWLAEEQAKRTAGAR